MGSLRSSVNEDRYLDCDKKKNIQKKFAKKLDQKLSECKNEEEEQQVRDQIKFEEWKAVMKLDQKNDCHPFQANKTLSGIDE